MKLLISIILAWLFLSLPVHAAQTRAELEAEMRVVLVKLRYEFVVKHAKQIKPMITVEKVRGEMIGSYSVRPISRNACADYILNIHYAKRWPSITYAFGLFDNEALVGIITYGTPPSAPLRIGIAGSFFKSDILELNRLCLRNNKRNEASRLVGGSLRALPNNRIIVSFADISQGHLGIVYQATNFLYTGLSAKRTDWKIRGREHLHGQTVADEFRGQLNRVTLMREKYGDDFYLSPRPRKHRYIYIKGCKSYRLAALAALKYPVVAYPVEVTP